MGQVFSRRPCRGEGVVPGSVGGGAGILQTSMIGPPLAVAIFVLENKKQFRICITIHLSSKYIHSRTADKMKTVKLGQNL